MIPDEASAVYFTNEVMPDNATAIDVDDDGDCGVTAWMDGSVMKISTQINDVKAIANVNSRNMFNCKSISVLDLSSFNTAKVTTMDYAFYACHGMTTLILGENFKFVGDTYSIPLSSWINSNGEMFESDGTNSNLPNNVSDIYKKNVAKDLRNSCG